MHPGRRGDLHLLPAAAFAVRRSTFLCSAATLAGGPFAGAFLMPGLDLALSPSDMFWGCRVFIPFLGGTREPPFPWKDSGRDPFRIPLCLLELSYQNPVWCLGQH